MNNVILIIVALYVSIGVAGVFIASYIEDGLPVEFSFENVTGTLFTCMVWPILVPWIAAKLGRMSKKKHMRSYKEIQYNVNVTHEKKS